MATPLESVTGIGPKTAEFLQGMGIGSAEALAAMDVEKLTEAPGFHIRRAMMVIEAAADLVGGANPGAEGGKEGLTPVVIAGDVKKEKKKKGKKKEAKKKDKKKVKKGKKKEKSKKGKGKAGKGKEKGKKKKGKKKK